MRVLENISQNTIKKEDSIEFLLKRLNDSIVKVLFLTDEDGRLIGTITDGDIRRAMLKYGNREMNASEIAVYNPKYIRGNRSDFNNLCNEFGITALPEIDSSGKIERILYKETGVSNVCRKKVEYPVVIMAGGYGTRLYPYTKVLPKALIPINGIPICERIISSLHESGCDSFHIIVNYKKNLIKSYFKESDFSDRIVFHDEDEPLGTAGGLKMLESCISDTFIMTNCDILIQEDLSDIIKYHKEKKNDLTIVCANVSMTIPYGIVNVNDKGELLGFEEKPGMSFITNTGFYIIEPSLFTVIQNDERIDMPDLIARYKDRGFRVGVYQIDDSNWYDMGQLDSMDRMEKAL